MDYFGFLGQGWKAVWRNKALLVFGLFASLSSTIASSSGSDSSVHKTPTSLHALLTNGLPSREASAVTALLGVLVLVLAVVALAARLGLIAESERALRGEPVSLRRGWGIGFRRWWRGLGIQFVLALPLLGIVVFVAAIAAIVFVGTGTLSSSGLSASSDAVVGWIVVIALVTLLALIPLAVVVSMLDELALRHGILRDRTLGRAIAAAWGDLRAKRGAFVMWLVMLLPEMVYGMVVFGVLMAVFVSTVIAAGIGSDGGVSLGGLGVAAAVALGVVSLAVVLAAAVFMAFQTTAWTAFFRATEPPAVEPPASGVAAPLVPEPPLAPLVATAGSAAPAPTSEPPAPSSPDA